MIKLQDKDATYRQRERERERDREREWEGEREREGERETVSLKVYDAQINTKSCLVNCNINCLSFTAVVIVYWIWFTLSV